MQLCRRLLAQGPSETAEGQAACSVYLTVLPEVNALILFELISQEVHNALVKVVTSKVGVTTGAQHLKHTITNLQHPKPDSQSDGPK